ncbi:MAG TPA: sulfatase, partial [Planctomycetaceae bacterium]|nr:sulfatase [Planctomycetaceae bacterium]
KRVIFLCMAGGMSHLETFDNKPKLREMNGKPMPDSFTKGQPIAQLQGKALTCLGGQHEFKKHGESGQELSVIFPKLADVVDDISIIRSLKTEAINHDPAHTFMNTGTTISGRPSMGSWLTYGLGTVADDLPGFVVLT